MPWNHSFRWVWVLETESVAFARAFTPKLWLFSIKGYNVIWTHSKSEKIFLNIKVRTYHMEELIMIGHKK